MLDEYTAMHNFQTQLNLMRKHEQKYKPQFMRTPTETESDNRAMTSGGGGGGGGISALRSANATNLDPALPPATLPRPRSAAQTGLSPPPARLPLSLQANARS